MKLTDELAERLVPTFQIYARHYARTYDFDAEELEAQMYLALCQKGERSTTRDGDPLLAQAPAYIAKRMAGWAAGRMRAKAKRERAQVELSESWAVTDSFGEVEENELSETVRALAERHGMDVTDTLDILFGEKTTPRLSRLAKRVRGMEAAEQRIAAHLFAGRSIRKLETAGIAPRRAASRVRRELVTALS